jgi:hypothetical protein
MSLVNGEWLPSVVYLQNNVIPAQNKKNDGDKSLKPMGIKKEMLFSQNEVVWKYINQQQMMSIVAILTIKNLVQDVGNKATND